MSLQQLSSLRKQCIFFLHCYFCNVIRANLISNLLNIDSSLPSEKDKKLLDLISHFSKIVVFHQNYFRFSFMYYICRCTNFSLQQSLYSQYINTFNFILIFPYLIDRLSSTIECIFRYFIFLRTFAEIKQQQQQQQQQN